MSTRVSSPEFPRLKKFSSRVRPGVTDTRARLFCPVSALFRLDFPTLDRPAKVTSGGPPCGSPSALFTPLMKLQGARNSASPLAISLRGSTIVLAGLLRRRPRSTGWHSKDVDGRDKPGHDECGFSF